MLGAALLGLGVAGLAHAQISTPGQGDSMQRPVDSMQPPVTPDKPFAKMIRSYRIFQQRAQRGLFSSSLRAVSTCFALAFLRENRGKALSAEHSGPMAIRTRFFVPMSSICNGAASVRNVVALPLLQSPILLTWPFRSVLDSP
jgi:hypothetical protein